MQPDPLENLLRDYSRQSLPPVPGDLMAGIHSEIRLRRRRSFWTRVAPLLDWRELFREPRLAVPALVCAVAIGILPAVVSAKSRADLRLARHSIHFNVFSSEAAPQLTRWVDERASTTPSPP